MSSPEAIKSNVKALAFDVFGTVVDWRSSVTSELASLAEAKLASTSTPALQQETLARLASEDWAAFAQAWRNTYKEFVRSFVPGETPWRDIDTHHLLALRGLLRERGLDDVYSEAELLHLSHVWHRLTPWDDSAQGLARLGQRYVTATLSNGNKTLLKDLDDSGPLGFQKLISAEDFKAYKPHPDVYLGAVRELGLEKPGELALVAAHLSDLWAAKQVGLRTVYVERPREEDWREDEERYKQAKEWVDIWVSEGEGGFPAVATALGI
ncbi:haloacid dehalogenase [Plectosphaerella plurivora]|uniref:Haloacid dehalogenase n=1 Tax=Plectosphaerella plurivora TaxID=936078 RepID=A0A9P8VP18_9PEZI|nr:haloacid dehalogenase [Plectosphaerella plurivora]